MLLGYGVALLILRELYLLWKDRYAEPDAHKSIFKIARDACLPNSGQGSARSLEQPGLARSIEFTRQFIKRDRELYGDVHVYRLRNIRCMGELLAQDHQRQSAAAWFYYGLRIIDELGRPIHKDVDEFELAVARFELDGKQADLALKTLQRLLDRFDQEKREKDPALHLEVLKLRAIAARVLPQEAVEQASLELLEWTEHYFGLESAEVKNILRVISEPSDSASMFRRQLRLLEHLEETSLLVGDETLATAQSLDELAAFCALRKSTGAVPNLDPSGPLRERAEQIRALLRVKRRGAESADKDDIDLAARFYETRNRPGDGTTAFHLRKQLKQRETHHDDRNQV